MKKSLLKLTGFAFLCATTFIGCGSTPKQETKPDPVKKVEEAKRQFEVRGLKVEIVNKKHFHVTYSQENIIFSPEQAQRNLDILTKRKGNNNK